MAFDPKPSSWISSFSEDGTTASFDLADLTETLTAAEADATSGDWRDVMWALCNHTYSYYYGLATADKPTKLVVTKSAVQQSDGTLANTFTFKFYTDINSQDVTSE